jgi:hypothetical protein
MENSIKGNLIILEGLIPISEIYKDRDFYIDKCFKMPYTEVDSNGNKYIKYASIGKLVRIKKVIDSFYEYNLKFCIDKKDNCREYAYLDANSYKKLLFIDCNLWNKQETLYSTIDPGITTHRSRKSNKRSRRGGISNKTCKYKRKNQ